MTLRVLEFNDKGLRLSDDSGVLHCSPGYALVSPQAIEFGDSARSQSRLNPLNSYNQFWHKLSVDPFAKPVGHFRHNADLAFSHLQHLAQQTEIEGDVLLALSGSFSRQQMAILLGLLKQSSMNAVGIVDAGLAATIDRHDAECILHADLELHQVVLSKLRKVGKDWQRESVLLVPSVGWDNISENLMQLFTTAFIQQCRFNPQHNAASEQMLFEGLPSYLQEHSLDQNGQLTEEAKSSLKIKLQHMDNVHEISLPRSSVYSRLNGFYQKILQQLTSLDATGVSPLFVSDRLGQLPQVLEVLAEHQGSRREVKLLPEDAVARSCLRYSDVLASSADAVRFVSQLESMHKVPESQSPAVGKRLCATHLLHGDIAVPLRPGVLVRQMGPEERVRIVDDAHSQLADNVVALAQISFENGQFATHQSGALQVNGKTAASAQALALGDDLQFSTLSESLKLIAVQEQDV